MQSSHQHQRQPVASTVNQTTADHNYYVPYLIVEATTSRAYSNNNICCCF